MAEQDPTFETAVADATTSDFDSPWKEILEAYFPRFMELFFPDAAADIDWTRPYDFLDTELQQVVRDADLGRRYADKLVRVFRRSGDETWVFAHIEVQGSGDHHFARRMFVYNYRLFDRYDAPIASFAVLADDRPAWRPHRFDSQLWGTHISMQFPTVKLLDLRAEIDALTASDNPFAIAVLAHLRAIDSRKDPNLRLRWKTELTTLLYDRGASRQDVLNLFRFIDWVLVLPRDLELTFRDTLDRLEQERHMPYVTSIERIGIEKGIEKGREQGEAIVLLRLLQRRFGPLPSWVDDRMAAATREQLDLWVDRVLDATSLDEVFAEQ